MESRDYHAAVWSAIVSALNQRPTLLPDPPFPAAEIAKITSEMLEQHEITNVSLEHVDPGGILLDWMEPPPKLPG